MQYAHSGWTNLSEEGPNAPPSSDAKAVENIVKMVEAPVFHVNADDPEAVLLATEIALDFRAQFQKDVVIDLVAMPMAAGRVALKRRRATAPAAPAQQESA